MSYENLIDRLLGKIPGEECNLKYVISEAEFCRLLPELINKATKEKCDPEILAMIIKKRFGLLGEKRHTLMQCSIEFGINKEHIRRLINRVIHGLWHPIRRAKWTTHSVYLSFPSRKVD